VRVSCVSCVDVLEIDTTAFSINNDYDISVFDVASDSPIFGSVVRISCVSCVSCVGVFVTDTINDDHYISVFDLASGSPYLKMSCAVRRAPCAVRRACRVSRVYRVSCVVLYMCSV